MEDTKYENLKFPIDKGSCSDEDIPEVFAHIKLLHVNARDIRSGVKLREIELIAAAGSADVICVSETFFSLADAEVYNLSGFNHLKTVRKKRRGGGVSVFVSSSFEILGVDSFSSEDENVQLLLCRIKRRNTLCYILAFYSNNRSQHDILLELLDNTLIALDLPVIVTGDSNINTLANDSVSNEYLSLACSRGLLPVIDGITRIESGTCLDHIFLPVGHVVQACSRIIETNTVSDHYPIWAAVCFNVAINTPTETSLSTIKRRIFSTRNFERFFSALGACDFSTIIQSDCVDTALSRFERTLFAVYNTAFPVKAFSMARHSPNPGFPDSLRLQRRKLDRLRRKYCSDKSNLISKWNYYSALKNYRFNRKQIYINFINKNLSSFRSASKVWGFVKKVLGLSKSVSGPTELKMGDALITDARLVGEIFVDLFANIGKTATSGIDQQNLCDVASLLPHRPLYLPFKLKAISAANLLRAASEIKTHFSGSLHLIPSRILKQALPYILEPVLHIFNTSVRLGRFPQNFKIATVIPLFKSKGSKLDPTNYRPISLCTYLSKLLEKCVSQQLYEFLESACFFSSLQFGFISNRSTDTAVCELYNRITQYCQNGNGVLCAFLDVAKAFDSVSPAIFNKILSLLDFDLLTRNWFLSYLTNRRIVVRIGQQISSAREVNLGIPQGSSLGPLIFVIYINVLLSYIETRPGLGACCYADDLTVFMQINKGSAIEGVQRLEMELQLLNTVYNSLNLSLNAQKTVVVLFSDTHSRITVPRQLILFDSVKISPVRTAKFLGIEFSEDLKWIPHFLSIRSKCYAVIAALSRLRQANFPVNALVFFYNALFVPILCYGLVLWGSAFDTHLRQLEVIQRDAVRALFKLPRRSNVTGTMLQYQIMSVKQLYYYRVSCLIYKQRSIGWFRFPSQYEHRRPPPYPLRCYDETDIVLSTERREYCLRSPLHQHGRVWNRIPAAIRSATSLRMFQKKLSAYLFQEHGKSAEGWKL